MCDGSYTRSDDESPPFYIRLKGASRSQHAPLADRPRRRKWCLPLPPALWLLATHDLFSFQGSRGERCCFPLAISEESVSFEPLKTRKFEKLFSLLTTFGKKPPVLNERKLKIQRKKPRKSSACGKSAIRRLIFRAYFHFVRSDPRAPNFAEIHARGRRGRLEYDHRDLIPPWGYRLLHGETGKPPCRSALIAIEVHCHHGGQGW